MVPVACWECCQLGLRGTSSLDVGISLEKTPPSEKVTVEVCQGLQPVVSWNFTSFHNCAYHKQRRNYSHHAWLLCMTLCIMVRRQLDVMDPTPLKDSCLIFGWGPRSRAESLSIAWWLLHNTSPLRYAMFINFLCPALQHSATLPLEAVRVVVCLPNHLYISLPHDLQSLYHVSTGSPFAEATRTIRSPHLQRRSSLASLCNLRNAANDSAVSAGFWNRKENSLTRWDSGKTTQHDQPFVCWKLWKCSQSHFRVCFGLFFKFWLNKNQKSTYQQHLAATLHQASVPPGTIAGPSPKMSTDSSSHGVF